jgi:hypothetical protein
MQAEENTSVGPRAPHLAMTRWMSISFSISSSGFKPGFFSSFQPCRSASDYVHQGSVGKNVETSVAVPEPDTSSAIQRQSDAASSNCDHLSGAACPVVLPVHYTSLYGSFSQIFTGYHHPPSRHANIMAKKKSEMHDTDKIIALYQNVCSHLQKYKTGKLHFGFFIQPEHQNSRIHLSNTVSQSPTLQVFRVSRNHPEVHYIVKEGEIAEE